MSSLFETKLFSSGFFKFSNLLSMICTARNFPILILKDSFQPTPPIYKVSDNPVPTAIFTATNDWLADPTDIATLKPQIKNLIYSKNIDDWNHLDFIWGENAYKVIYPDIIALMKKMMD